MASFHAALLKALARPGGSHTAYQMAQMLSAEHDYTNQEFRTAQQRWQRWLSGSSLKTVEQMAADLESLGLEIRIMPKE